MRHNIVVLSLFRVSPVSICCLTFIAFLLYLHKKVGGGGLTCDRGHTPESSQTAACSFRSPWCVCVLVQRATRKPLVSRLAFFTFTVGPHRASTGAVPWELPSCSSSAPLCSALWGRLQFQQHWGFTHIYIITHWMFTYVRKGTYVCTDMRAHPHKYVYAYTQTCTACVHTFVLSFVHMLAHSHTHTIRYTHKDANRHTCICFTHSQKPALLLSRLSDHLGSLSSEWKHEEGERQSGTH